ncbi:MAG TPA: hypothetical protein DEQ74_02420 [Wolbachia sp.]|jgi:outer membrane lipoprotein SlyB|uniref:actin-bundling T4SS effector WalE1 family protein n=1 Tax=Wolbachia endosymbiont of Pentalonia nigronervosa TaxID=1301914 RepID=UPI000ECF59CC|nr:hypothetical protein [Wolbachia endosymbiont of Pentalonia nigronervosa]MBD0390878.1 hypothetical protein [Wolbachia endosymbiont of Pentalonia nigronervosa]HCE59662.1 hypothetical protein [Wolbachia sp.]
MTHKQQNANPNVQGRVHNTAPVNGIKASEDDAKFVNPTYGWDGMTGQDQSVSGDSHHSEDDLDQISAELQVLTEKLDAEIQALDNKGNAQRNPSPTWGDNNNVEAGSNPGFTDNFANWDHFSVTASHEPFGDAVNNQRDVKVLRNFAPVIANPTRLANFDNESRPYRSSHLNDEGYDSSPDYGDDLDHESEEGNKKFKFPKTKEEAAELFGIAGKRFSELPIEKQVILGAAAGALLAIALPVLLFAVAVIAAGAVVGAAGAVVGAVVGAGLYAGVKTVQGFNWTAKKTIEGTKIAAGKIASAYAAADQKVRKATSDGLRSVANRLEKLAGKTNHPEELTNLDETTKENCKKAVKVLQDKVLGNPDFSQEERESIVAATMGKVAFKLGLKITTQENITKDPNATEYAREEAQEYCELWTKQKNFISGLNFKKLGNLLDSEYKSAPRDLYLFKTALADHHGEVNSAVHEAVQEFLEYKQERANAASNAESKPKLFGWFKSKPKAVSDDSGLESDATSQTSLSESLPESRRGSYAGEHTEDRATPLVTSRPHVPSYGTFSSPNNISGSESDNLANSGSSNSLSNGSADSGVNSPTEGSPVHGNNLLKPNLGEIGQTRLKNTGDLRRLVNVDIERHVGNEVTVN